MSLWKYVLAVGVIACGVASAQNDWPTYGRDLAGTRYSPLKQINTTNVTQLARAWTYHMAADTAAPGRAEEGNEVQGGRGRGRWGSLGTNREGSAVINRRVVYLTTAYGRVAALE